MRIGLLTGGGDCPGLNAVIRAVVRRGLSAPGNSFVGFRGGWAGLLSDEADELTRTSTSGILPRGGTILGTSRTNPYADGRDGTAAVRETLKRREIDALIPIGGEDTLGVALRLHEDGIPVVGRAEDDRQRPRRHRRHVRLPDGRADRDRGDRPPAHDGRVARPRDGVEVMGRHAGWIATHAGIAGGADAILVPERPFDVEEVCAHLQQPARPRGAASRSSSSPRGRRRAEGTLRRGRGRHAARAPTRSVTRGSAGSACVLEREIERRTGYESPRHDPRPRAARRYAGRVRSRARHPLRRRRVDAVAGGRFGSMVGCAAPASSRLRSSRPSRAEAARPGALPDGRAVLRVAPCARCCSSASAARCGQSSVKRPRPSLDSCWCACTRAASAAPTCTCSTARSRSSGRRASSGIR